MYVDRTGSRQFSAICALLVMGSGACRNEAKEADLSGRYSHATTSALTYEVPGRPEHCGHVMPPRAGEQTIAVHHEPGAKTARVTIEEEGCSFDADVRDGGEIAAADVDCVLADGSPLRAWGVRRRTYELFSLDTTSGAVRRVFRDERGTAAEPAGYCGVTEGVSPARAALPSGSRRVVYDGAYRWTWEQIVGTECRAYQDWTSRGYLTISPGSNDDEIKVQEESTGCTVVARRETGEVYSADGATCELDAGFGWSQLGVTQRSFSTFRLDLAAGKLEYQSMLRRIAAEGEREQCAQADFALTMEAAAPSESP